MITDKRIDGGISFDWGIVSQEYAKFQDIYPEKFYKELFGLGIGHKRQKALELGTGTGVIPRNMYHYGADFMLYTLSVNCSVYHINALRGGSGVIASR